MKVRLRLHLKQLLFVGFHKVCFSSSQIAALFDHQYIPKESTDTLVFLHAVSHQGKVAFETTTFG